MGDAETERRSAAALEIVVRPCDEPAPPRLREAIEQFNRGEYFKQHETLELLWREELRPVRALYQGILQVGVALYHVQRGNHHGAVYMLTRAAEYLRPFAPECQGVDVSALLAAAESMRQRVEALGPTRLDEFDWSVAPKVRLTPDASCK